MRDVLPLSLLQTVLLPATESSRCSEDRSFARVCAGFGYLLQGTEAKPLAKDELILFPPGVSVRLRASQLSALALCEFEVCPGELPGLFSLREECALAVAAQEGRVGLQVLGAESALARQFAALCALREREPALVLRSEMLRLAAHALREAARAPLPPAPSSSLEDRFRKLLAAAPRTDLLSLPACQLARQCGCSERHFRRLFKEETGLSLRAWQIQSRLRKAARLLRESDTKVVDVALQCGFQHLGQFNAAFKRLFDKTPSSWRRRPARKQPLICLRSAGSQGCAVPREWRGLRGHG